MNQTFQVPAIRERRKILFHNLSVENQNLTNFYNHIIFQNKHLFYIQIIEYMKNIILTNVPNRR